MTVEDLPVKKEVAVEQPGKCRAENGASTSSSNDEDNEMDSKPSNGEHKNHKEKEKNEISENGVYFDKNEGTTLQLSFSGKNLEDVDIQKLVNAVINNQTTADVKDNIESALNASTSNPTLTDGKNVATRSGARENVRIDIEEGSDAEVIELEFERAVEKVHTHTYTPYFPNCGSQITKVILRRKTKPVIGCLSCFRIFTLPVGGCFVLFGMLRSKSLEILKCIIHGGLIESVASLSVVSSAAASGATTLNIFALGLASVISGLFVFGKNLMDLKNENANQETDRYEELLGRRGHFLLHATLAVLSFLVFGIIPPIVYGFTFRESDNKDYKILAVAAASFACLFILAIGKAYTRRSQKFSDYVKTILYYIIMAISVAGVAYAAGDLIKMLMDRLGWLVPNQTAPSFVPDMISATPTRASY